MRFRTAVYLFVLALSPVASGEDCNRNGIPDDAEIADGSAVDCNGNGIPDACDLPHQTYLEFPELFPSDFATGPVVFEWESLSAASEIRIALWGQTNPHEIQVVLNGVEVGRLRRTASGGCFREGHHFWVDREVFNQALSGLARLELISLDEDPICNLRCTVRYEEWNLRGDCDENGVPDDCQFLTGELFDVNGNGFADSCEADCDQSGVPDSIELANGTLVDCNGNGMPDVCDLGFEYASPSFTVAGEPNDLHLFGLPHLPPPSAKGKFFFESVGGIGDAYASFFLGSSESSINERNGTTCDPDADMIMAPLDPLAAGISDGLPTMKVSLFAINQACSTGSLRWTLTYPSAFSLDCDENGRPDECDVTDPNRDCDADGHLDVCELMENASLLPLIVSQFDALYNAIVGPLGPYRFEGGETGGELVDDGAGSFSVANRLLTQFVSGPDSVPYTNGQVWSGDDTFGPGSRYATRKRPGVFALFVEDLQCSWVESRGNGTSSDWAGVRLFCSVNEQEYTILVGRWTGYASPSPHLIFVVPGSYPFLGNDSEVRLTSTGGLNAKLTGPALSNDIDRVLYMFVMSESGTPLSDAEIVTMVTGAVQSYPEADIDCNDNGVLDNCEAASDPAADLDGNGALDVCEPDCNGNSLPDALDIAAGALDCDQNGIPDECEPDCDEDGVTDRCEILAGAEDCDRNGVPDTCDITDPNLDCNGNGQPDACDVGVVDTDCNRDGVLDGCEIAADPETDCNGNGLPDDCDLPRTFETSRLGPLVPGTELTETLERLPIATAPVRVTVRGRADFSRTQRLIELRVNRTLVRSVFDESLTGCGPPDVEVFDLTAEEFNELVPDGRADIGLTPRRTQDCTVSWVELTLDFSAQAISADRNSNGVPDECDLEQCPGDADLDGDVDLSDLGLVIVSYGASGAGVLGDVNLDEKVDLTDLAIVITNFGAVCE